MLKYSVASIFGWAWILLKPINICYMIFLLTSGVFLLEYIYSWSYCNLCMLWVLFVQDIFAKYRFVFTAVCCEHWSTSLCLLVFIAYVEVPVCVCSCFLYTLKYQFVFAPVYCVRWSTSLCLLLFIVYVEVPVCVCSCLLCTLKYQFVFAPVSCERWSTSLCLLLFIVNVEVPVCVCSCLLWTLKFRFVFAPVSCVHWSTGLCSLLFIVYVEVLVCVRSCFLYTLKYRFVFAPVYCVCWSTGLCSLLFIVYVEEPVHVHSFLLCMLALCTPGNIKILNKVRCILPQIQVLPGTKKYSAWLQWNWQVRECRFLNLPHSFKVRSSESCTLFVYLIKQLGHIHSVSMILM